LLLGACEAPYIPASVAAVARAIPSIAMAFSGGSSEKAGPDPSATVFVDATRAAGLSGDARKELYQRLLFRSELLSDLSHGAMATPISVRDATSHTASDLIEEDYIRIGEAAFSIDPLSSQGVQSAILSAIHGAAATPRVDVLSRPSAIRGE
jgi:hypothetical protein